MTDRIFTHQVIDEFGDTLMKFQSLREAKWFVQNKPNCTIEKLVVLQITKDSAYKRAYESVGECLF